jgi:hypothetical protein
MAALLLTTCFASAQSQDSTQPAASPCASPAAEISRISRPTGVLRADPNANDTAGQKIAADVEQACANLSAPAAMRQVRLKISDNNIIVSGVVPTRFDEQQLLNIVAANADGRTVFNRLVIGNRD